MAEGKFTKEMVEMTEQQKKAQKARNKWIAIAIGLFVLLIYVATWAKLGANLLQRPL